MSSRASKRRSSGQTYGKLTPEPKQRYFTPRTKRIRSKPSPTSTTMKKQQTITQIQPFRDLYHPDQDEDLAYEQSVDDAEQEVPPKKKRRKTTPVHQENSLTQMGYVSNSLRAEVELDVLQEVDRNYLSRTWSKENKRRKTMPSGPTHAVQTRSSRGKAVQKKIKHEHDAAGSAESSTVEKPYDAIPETAAALMPPPKTPKSLRRKEIPSSQSPADTPLSNQSRKSQREQSRSPLKERSTNLLTCPQYPRKTIGQVAKLVAADSIDGTSTDNSTSVLTELKVTPTATALVRTAASAPTSQGYFATREPDPTVVSSEQTGPAAHDARNEAGIANSEILDSDEDSGDDFSDSNPNVVTEPQQEHATMSLAISDDPVKFTINNRGYQSNSWSLENTSLQEVCNPDAEPGMPKYNFARHSQASEEPQPHAPHHPRSDSEEASAQLTAEFMRTTQPPPLVESDSQWKTTWHPCSGPKAYEHPGNDFSSSPTSSNPPAFITPRLTKSQPLPPSSPVRLPPSQATTVDITQPSPQLSSSAQHPSHQLPTLSFPPLLPPISSSSPLRTRKDGEAYVGCMGYMGAWNGERLTDSQLLPESLMEDSMVEVPEVGFLEE